MEGQTKITTRMTYRATATGDGKKDFIGNITFPNNDFASGDTPLDKDEYELLKSNGMDMIHLPTGPVSPLPNPHQTWLTWMVMAG